MKVLVIDPGPVNSTARLVEVPHTLAAFNELVGGSIEGLTLGSGVSAYINEDGKALGLPVNVVGDQIVRVLLSQTGRRLMPGDVIVGPIVFLGLPDDDGEDRDVPQAFVDWFASIDGVEVNDESTGDTPDAPTGGL